MLECRAVLYQSIERHSSAARPLFKASRDHVPRLFGTKSCPSGGRGPSGVTCGEFGEGSIRVGGRHSAFQARRSDSSRGLY
jgi:hypothetical protein